MQHTILAVTILLAGCASPGLPTDPCRWAYYDDSTTNVTNYRFVQDAETFSGIAIDRNGWDVDLREIDRQTAELEECLGAPIRRCGFAVLVAPDAFIHPLTHEFVHPCDSRYVPSGLCYGAVQEVTTVVVTPDLSAFKHESIHIVTHRSHGHEVFQRCQ